MSLKYDGNAYSANVNCLLNLVSLGKVNRLEVHKIASHFVFIARKSIQPFRVIYANSSLFWQVWKKYEFWCEGIFFGIFGLFGLIFNLTSVLTLTSKEMRKHTFNQLLAILTLCETL